MDICKLVHLCVSRMMCHGRTHAVPYILHRKLEANFVMPNFDYQIEGLSCVHICGLTLTKLHCARTVHNERSSLWPFYWIENRTKEREVQEKYEKKWRCDGHHHLLMQLSPHAEKAEVAFLELVLVTVYTELCVCDAEKVRGKIRLMKKENTQVKC